MDVGKSIKSDILVYLIYVKESLPPNVSNNSSISSNNHDNQSKEQNNLDIGASQLNEFLKEYDACFFYSILATPKALCDSLNQTPKSCSQLNRCSWCSSCS